MEYSNIRANVCCSRCSMLHPEQSWYFSTVHLAQILCPMHTTPTFSPSTVVSQHHLSRWKGVQAGTWVSSQYTGRTITWRLKSSLLLVCPLLSFATPCVRSPYEVHAIRADPTRRIVWEKSPIRKNFTNTNLELWSAAKSRHASFALHTPE